MATHGISERISIKNLLFTKAMPNYKIPIPIHSSQCFSCRDCGDRYMFESSLMIHINRRSLKIYYFCRFCGKLHIFFNRCQFLSHIRSHVTKTATINLSDLKIEPLPLITPKSSGDTTQNIQDNQDQISSETKVCCFECKKDITITKCFDNDRARHYMQNIFKIVTCPICLFSLPSACALIAHLRIHLKTPPFFCSECGKELPLSACYYPYNHDCDGFKMMRVTSRIRCIKDTCPVLHPTNYISHMRRFHFNTIYKCPSCYLAGYNENAVLKHVMRCCDKTKYPTYHECQQCPGVFLISNQITKHLDNHFSTFIKNEDAQIYPCWNCGFSTHNVRDFLKHHVASHCARTTLKTLVNVLNHIKCKDCTSCIKKIYFWKDNDNSLPTRCSECLQNESSRVAQIKKSNNKCKEPQIVCHLCKIKVNESWKDVKLHFNEFHNNIKCLDIKLVLNRINLKDVQKEALVKSSNTRTKKICKQYKQKRLPKRISRQVKKNNFTVKITPDPCICPKCNCNIEDKQCYESHIKTHRDPDMAYQCMECGQCFAVKPSFSTHLLLEHNILDVNMYVSAKNCFNENALNNYKVGSAFPEEYVPLEENQCNICRDKFLDSISLEKHFRVHGMAFLIKNTQKSKSP